MSRICVKNLPKNVSQEEIKTFFTVKGEVTDLKLLKNSNGKSRQMAFVGFREPGIEDDLVKYFNRNYMRTSKIQVEKAIPTAQVQNNEESKKTLEEVEGEFDLNRLFVRNLSYTTTEDDLSEVFRKFGEIQELHLPIDKKTLMPKGFAYIRYSTTEAAVSALAELDRSIFLGRILHVMQAKHKTQVEIKGKLAPSSYKRVLAEKLKERAADPKTWNSLFLNPDTVAEYTAKRLSQTKGEFLDTESDNLAAKLALAETDILKDTKQWMESQEINPKAFKGDRESARRSKSVIIVKNLHKHCSLSEINSLFSRYGGVNRCVMHPSGCIAIVEFMDTSHAENAFTHLSNYELKSLPLYLEYAPLNVFTDAYVPETITKTKQNTLFVKNLNFSTTKESLKAHMSKTGEISSVKLVKNNGLPAGYGFVEYANTKSASKALRNLNNSLLDGHALKLSEAKTTIEIPAKRNRETEEPNDQRTKLTVKNLAFEATKDDLKQVFSEFGDVKAIRIPNKVTGGHRGFAFVEFLTHDDAENAISSLMHTHLYGRRLVIEWSESLDVNN